MEVLDNLLGDEDPTPEQEAASAGFVDPTSFLEKRSIEIPRWIQDCDDYRLVVLVIIEIVL